MQLLLMLLWLLLRFSSGAMLQFAMAKRLMQLEFEQQLFFMSRVQRSN
jgi:surfactin synthase thioesterase subunit